MIYVDVAETPVVKKSSHVRGTTILIFLKYNMESVASKSIWDVFFIVAF